MIQQVENLKHKMKSQWGNIRVSADENIQNAKTKIRQSQSYGVSKLVQTQIETDKWLRKTASQLQSEKTAKIQDKIIEFSNFWMPLSIENYDSLNAKKAAKQAKSLGLKELLRIRYYEEGTKNRKTVLKAIDARLEQYNKGLVE